MASENRIILQIVIIWQSYSEHSIFKSQLFSMR